MADSKAMRLQIYIEGEYCFYSEVDPMKTVLEYTKQLEKETQSIFSTGANPIVICGLQDSNRNDLNAKYIVGSVLSQDDFVFPLRELITIRDGLVTPIVLDIPTRPVEPEKVVLPQSTNVISSAVVQHDKGVRKRCTPYCRPLSPYGITSQICTICGEIKAYKPIEGPYCTELCVTGEHRKLKSQALDFCSICLSRYRHMKYAKGVQHQCSICHRPWLILNDHGHCRTCHVRLVGKPPARKRSRKDMLGNGIGGFGTRPISSSFQSATK